MLLSASDTPMLLCWLQIMKHLPFWGCATLRKKKNEKYLVVFDDQLENSWRTLTFQNHCAFALRQPGCFQAYHTGHLPKQPLKLQVCLENLDGRLWWRKLSVLLLLKLLIFTSSVFKLLFGIICSQKTTRNARYNWRLETCFILLWAKDLIFLGFLGCSDSG